MADLNTIDIFKLSIGTDISFKTKHPNDDNLYSGTLIGFGSYDMVRNLMDLLPYYQSVKKVIKNMEPIDKLKYFIIQYQQENSTRKFVCAEDWVNTSSITVINLDAYFDIRIYNRDTTVVDESGVVINLLNSHGYNCSLQKYSVSATEEAEDFTPGLIRLEKEQDLYELTITEARDGDYVLVEKYPAGNAKVPTLLKVMDSSRLDSLAGYEVVYHCTE